MFRRDPGPCIVCGAPHSTCTSDSGPKGAPIHAGAITPATRVEVPVGSARAVAADTPLEEPAARPALAAETTQATLPPGRFTTGTYRRGSRKSRSAEE